MFAITQIATLISHHPDAAGTGKGVLVALLVWWRWSQFTWAGSAIDLHRTTFTRVLVLAIIPVTLLMTAAIPEAFANTGVWFGATYLGVQLLVLAIHAVPAMASAATRTGFVRYASFAVCAPLLVLLGSFAHGQARVLVWVLAAVANLIGGLRAGCTGWVGHGASSEPCTSANGTRCGRAGHAVACCGDRYAGTSVMYVVPAFSLPAWQMCKASL